MISVHELPAKIAATNRANQLANEWQAKLLAVFAKHVGQKILKADGSLLAKIEKELPERPCTHNVRIYRHHSNYSLAWVVNVSERIDNIGTTYAEAVIYVGSTRGDQLTGLEPVRTLRTDYSLAELAAARERTAAAKKAYDEAREACYPFGEY